MHGRCRPAACSARRPSAPRCGGCRRGRTTSASLKPLTLDDQRVAVPLAVRPAHPAIDRRLGVVRHVHDAVRARVLVDEEDVAVCPARSGTDRACRSSAECRPCSTWLPDRSSASRRGSSRCFRRRRGVGNHAVGRFDDDALAGRNGADGAELPELAWPRPSDPRGSSWRCSSPARLPFMFGWPAMRAGERAAGRAPRLCLVPPAPRALPLPSSRPAALRGLPGDRHDRRA